MTLRIPRRNFRGLSRRRFLSSAAVTGISAIAWPHISRAADRPAVTHGVQSGDVGTDAGVVWARADRPSQMLVEVATTKSFKDVRALPPIAALPESDFTAKMLLENLPGGQDIFYRVKFRDLSHTSVESEPVAGRFRTAPSDKRDVSFVWGGDVAGQGWGINPDDGGMFTFSAMKKHRPDFFLHSGDTIYADGLIASEVKLADGKIWKNVTIPEKAKVAETLDEFRAAHKYNFLDDNVRSLQCRGADLRAVGRSRGHQQLVGLERPSRGLQGAQHRAACGARRACLPRDVSDARKHRRTGPGLSHPRATARISTSSCSTSAAIAARTVRTSRPTYGPDAHFLGPEQMAWLKRALLNSRATWKVIASDMPLSLIVWDDAANKKGSEAFAQGNGPARGRELEIADLLRFIKTAPIRNTVWLTADVHYAAAHYYDPNKAQFQDFEPFWEFVSGPLHAGTFGPNELDNTFGPEVRFIKAPGLDKQNLPPSAGMQFFGHVKIDGATGQMTVTLRDRMDVALWSTTLDPKVA